MFFVIGIVFLVLRTSDAVGEECGDFCDELIQDEVRKECGSQNGTKLYCRSFYHCCDADTATCCGAGHICSGASCISIAVIVFPIIAVLIVVSVTIVIIVNRTKSC